MNTLIGIKNFEPSIYRHRAIVEFRILEASVSRAQFKDYLKNISTGLEIQTQPEQPEPIIASATGHNLQKHQGLQGIIFGLESGLHAHYWERPQAISLDIHSCIYLDKDIIENVTRSFFKVSEYAHLDLNSSSIKVDSKKVEIKTTKFGKSVFAREFIQKDEFIAGFYGEIYEAANAMSLAPTVVNHAIQFSECKWRDANGLARYLNHSCEPNCGIKGLFDIVAMTDIQVGTELCWDYAMTENSNWIVPGNKCECGSQQCRTTISPYRELPQETKDKYINYTSDWLKLAAGSSSCVVKKNKD